MNREILRLAIPNIISNISVPLLSTVDTALMGRLSELHIGAVGIGSMIFNFIYWNAGFLRMGTTGLTAQAFGKRDDAIVTHTIGRALLVAMSIAAGLMLLQFPLGKASFFLMNVTDEQRTLVSEYFYIRIWAAPASLGLYAMLGWFFGMQNAIYPLILTIVINIVNIAMSFFFVAYLGMEVRGVALGTVIAQYFGFLLALALFYYKHSDLLAYFKLRAIAEWQKLRQFLVLNRDIFIRTLLLTLGFAFFYSQSALTGELMLAVNVILLQFVNWMSYGIDGFAYASESLVGKYKGAADDAKTHQAIRLSFAWGMGMAAMIGAVYGFFGENLLRVFTDQMDVLIAAQPYLIWMILFPILSTPCYIWDGVFIGLTASKSMRNAMLLSAIFYVAAYLIFYEPYGNHGLWLTLLIFMVARGIIQQIFFWRKGLAME